MKKNIEKQIQEIENEYKTAMNELKEVHDFITMIRRTQNDVRNTMVKTFGKPLKTK